MINRMEHTNHSGLLLLFSGYGLNLLSRITQSDVTFMLGTIATVLAIVHYYIQIKKNTRK